MSSFYTSDSLIRSVIVRASIPEAQNVFQTDDFLRFANEEMKLKLLPIILDVKEEYYVTYEDITLVANQQEYPIPYRAIGSKIRDAVLIDPNTTPNRIMRLTRIQPELEVDYQGAYSTFGTTGFKVQNDSIVLIPQMQSAPTYKLRLYFYLKPNQLVDESRIGVISQIDTGTNTVTLNEYNTDLGLAAGTLMDFLQATPFFKTRAYDQSVVSTNPAQKTITFSSLPSGLKVGDHVALAGECMIPQVPEEMHPLLAQAVACRCLEALGDTQGLANANVKLEEISTSVLAIIDSRTEGNPQKVVNVNSFLRRAGNGFRRRGGSY